MRFRWVILVAACCLLSAGFAAAKKGKTSKKAENAVAVVDDKTITLSELEAKAHAELLQLRQQEYQIKDKVLQQMINDMLTEAEAKKKGISVEEFQKQEIDGKLDSVPQDKVDAYYNRIKGRYRGTKEQAESQIRKMFRNEEFVKELRAKHNVNVMLEPLRMDVSIGDDPTRGPKNAPIVLIEFSDYECPYSMKIQPTIAELEKKYGDKILFVYKDFPLGFHKNAIKAAEAAHCAGEQGKYWEYHGKIYENPKGLSVDKFKAFATALGLDGEKFNTCLDTGRFTDEVKNDMSEGQKLGVRGTPGIFVNGIFTSGAYPLEHFTDIIDRELAAKKK